MRLVKASLLLFILLAAAIPALGENTGSITVDVKGYDGVSEMAASLTDPERGFLTNQTVRSETFSFENVTIGKEYYILIIYKGVPYLKKVVMDEASERVEFTVFEVTTDDADIALSFHKMVLKVKGNTLNLVEALIYENMGTRVFNGTLHVDLPTGYENLNTSIMGCCIERTAEGFTVTNLMETIKPNDLYQVTFIYAIHPTAGEYIFTKKAVYFTSNLMVMVEEEENTQLKDTGGLVNEGTIDFEGKNYNLFTASNLLADEAISLTVSGFTTEGGLTTMWMGAALIAAVVATLGFMSVKLRRQTTNDFQAKKEAVFSVLDRLEKDFKNGKIEEREYEALRAKYKEEAARILKEIDELEKQGDAG